MAFRFKSYQDYKSYVGRVSGTYDLIEIGARDLQARFGSPVSGESLRDHGKQYGLNVHFETCPELAQTVIGLNIVAGQDAFDGFLRDFEQEHKELHPGAWKSFDKKSAIYTAIQNVCDSQKNGVKQIGEAPVAVCKYYRLLRNSIVHRDNKQIELRREFEKLQSLKSEIVQKYETVVYAPSLPEELNRDDLQLSIRGSLDVAWKLSKLSQPSHDRFVEIAKDVRARFLKIWPTKERRVRSALIGYFTFTFGFSRTEAKQILDGAF